MSKQYWAILDHQGDVIGEWSGEVHWVGIYETRKEAKEEAMALSIPNYKICEACEALTKKPSQLST